MDWCIKISALYKNLERNLPTKLFQVKTKRQICSKNIECNSQAIKLQAFHSGKECKNKLALKGKTS